MSNNKQYGKTSSKLAAHNKTNSVGSGAPGFQDASFKRKILKNYMDRKFLLVVPEYIKEKHKDRHFVYINYNEMQKNGFWHPEGYKLHKEEIDTEAVTSNFSEASDGLIHRNEMVLAWLPKETWEERQAEKALVREMSKAGTIFEGEAFDGFDATFKEESEKVSLGDINPPVE